MKNKTICKMPCSVQISLIFRTLIVYLLTYFYLEGKRLCSERNEQQNPRFGFTRNDWNESGFFFWMSLDRSPCLLNRSFRANNSKLQVFWVRFLQGGFTKNYNMKNSTTALKEANSVAAGSKWKAAMAKHSLSFLFLSVLFFASRESKQW